MTILCGVEESASSLEAARAAAALAKRTKDELCLVHVRDVVLPALAPGLGPVPYTLPVDMEAQRTRALGELERERKRLGDEFQITVSTQVRFGLPDVELETAANELDASLIVVASLGRRSGSMWRLGSVADKLSQSSDTTVLIVRDATAFDRWAKEDRPLQALVALGDGATTQPALDALANLRKFGPCESDFVHVYDPGHEARRLGLQDAWSDSSRALIENSLKQDLLRRFPGIASEERLDCVAGSTRTSVAESVVEASHRFASDMVLVGTHGKGALRRKIVGSVSYGVIPLADTNVLVVKPGKRARRQPVAAPGPLRQVLVPVDFSVTGRRALQFAQRLLPAGGKLFLLHVFHSEPIPSGLVPHYYVGSQATPEKLRMDQALAGAELERLAADIGDAVQVEREVVSAEFAPRAILEAAERHAVDLVCLGTRGLSGLAGAVLGSVAREVSQRSHRPVLLVPPPADA